MSAQSAKIASELIGLQLAAVETLISRAKSQGVDIDLCMLKDHYPEHPSFVLVNSLERHFWETKDEASSELLHDFLADVGRQLLK